ncbi:MAG: SPOR domain-containing protein [Pseudomonadota bacterium]
MKERLIGAIVLVLVAWLLIPIFLDNQPESSTAEMTTRTVNLPGVDTDANGQPTQTRTIQLRPRDDADESDEEDESATTLVLPPPVAREAEPVIESESSTAVEAGAETAVSVAQPDTEVADSQVPPAREADNREELSDTAAQTAEVDPADLLPEPESVAEPVTQAAAPPASSSSSAAGLWVVQVGSFGQRGNAENLMQALITAGYPAFVSEVQSNGRRMHRVRVGPQKDRDAADRVAAELKQQGQSAARSVPYP